MKGAVLALGACFTLLVAVAPARQGGCGALSLDDYLKHSDVAAIFTGMVTAVKAVPNSSTWPRDRRQIGTMTVTRVWKGEVSSTTALHLWFTEGRDREAGFQPSVEYVAIAHELSPESRASFGLPWTGERELGVNGWGSCSVMQADGPSALRLIGAAPGYPPKP